MEDQLEWYSLESILKMRNSNWIRIVTCLLFTGLVGCNRGCDEYYSVYYDSTVDDPEQAQIEADADTLDESDGDFLKETGHDDFDTESREMYDVDEYAIDFECINGVFRSGDSSYLSIEHRKDIQKLKGYRVIDANIFIVSSDDFGNFEELSCVREAKNLIIRAVFSGLSGISQLEHIYGGIDGLPIDKVPGTLSIQGADKEGFIHEFPTFTKLVESSVSISCIHNLKEIRGFNSLRVGDDITIWDCSDLETVSGFNNLSHGAYNNHPSVAFGDNPQLEMIEGFESLHEAESIELYDLNSTTIKAFKNLETIHYSLNISNSSFIADGAFEKLHTIENGFDLTGNKIKDVDAFSSLRHVGQVSIDRNSELQDISGLFGIEKLESDNLAILDNPKLPQCQVEKFVELMRSRGWEGTAHIEGNDENATCEP